MSRHHVHMIWLHVVMDLGFTWGLWNLLVSLLSLVKDGCKHSGRGENPGEVWSSDTGIRGGVSDNKSISRKDTLIGWDMCLKRKSNMMGEPDGETDQAESHLRGERFGDRAALAGSWFTNWHSCKGRAGRTKERQTLQTGRFGSNKQGA